MKVKRTRELPVHTWGGLGSQLFSLVTYLDLSLNHGHERMAIALHNGGVTRRESEIQTLASDLNLRFISDFQQAGNQSPPLLRSVLQSLGSKFLHSVGLVESLESRQYPFPWVRSIRGHYTYRRIHPESLGELVKRVQELLPGFTSEKPRDAGLGIHYRLGDLETLNDKYFIDPSRIRTVIQDFSNVEVHVYSDSPESAKLKLESSNTYFFSLPAIETIVKLVNYEVFIGTNSKISQWIAIFRLFFDNHSICWLPSEFKTQFEKSLPESLNPINLFYY